MEKARANIDYCGIIMILRRLVREALCAEAEAKKIAARIAVQTGADIIDQGFYGYERGAVDKPAIIPGQAEVVRQIYADYLAGDSIQVIRDRLEARNIPNASGNTAWTANAVNGILTNEKYCGDVLRQKTFILCIITAGMKMDGWPGPL